MLTILTPFALGLSLGANLDARRRIQPGNGRRETTPLVDLEEGAH